MKMGVCKLEVSLLFLMGLVMVDIIYAQNSPDDFVKPHNEARAQIGVGPLTWDDSIAEYAQNFANLQVEPCKMAHSGGPYNENLAGSTGELSATEAVNLWVAEKPYYNFESNSCVGGECHHYTQVVWRDSVRLGCGRVSCNNGGTFIVCEYDPPGNWVGERPF